MATHADADEEEEWDKDSDEIEALASDELHETRPNRWTGPEKLWRKFTAQDRETWEALEGERREDLAVHLYNAYALKRRARENEVGAASPFCNTLIIAPQRLIDIGPAEAAGGRRREGEGRSRRWRRRWQRGHMEARQALDRVADEGCRCAARGPDEDG